MKYFQYCGILDLRQNHGGVCLNFVKLLDNKKTSENFHILEIKHMYVTGNFILQHFLFLF